MRVAPSATGDPVYAFYHQRLRDAAHGRDDRRCAPRAARALATLVRARARRPRPARVSLAAGRRARARRALGDRRRRCRARPARVGLAADWYGKALALGRRCRAVSRPQLRRVLFLGGKLADAAAEFEPLALAERRAAIAGACAPPRRTSSSASSSAGSRCSTACSSAAASRAHALAPRSIVARRRRRRALARRRCRARAGAGRRRARRRVPRDRELPVDAVSDRVVRVRAARRRARRARRRSRGARDGHGDARRRTSRPARSAGSAIARSRPRSGCRRRAARRIPRMVAAGASGIARHAARRLAGDAARARGRRADLQQARPRALVGGVVPAQLLGARRATTPASRRARSRCSTSSTRRRATIIRARDARQLSRPRARARRRPRRRARAAPRSIARRPRGSGLASIYRQVFHGELALAEHDVGRAPARSATSSRAMARTQWLLGDARGLGDDRRLCSRPPRSGSATRARRPRAHARARAVSPRPVVVLRRDRAAAVGAGGSARSARSRRTAGCSRGPRTVAAERGGKLDRLAIAALAGEPIDAGPLALAVRWSTGRMLSRRCAMATVIVIGGGVGGLTAAHELAERGLHRHRLRVATRLGRQGAQPARPRHRHERPPRSARRARLPLLSALLHARDRHDERGSRTRGRPRRRSPAADDRERDRARSTTQHLVPLLSPAGHAGRSTSSRRSSCSSRSSTSTAGDIGAVRREDPRVLHLERRAPARRVREASRGGTFLEGDLYSPKFQRQLRAVPRTMVAMDPRAARRARIGTISMQLILDYADTGVNNDRTMGGPTTEMWIDPWIAHLRSARRHAPRRHRRSPSLDVAERRDQRRQARATARRVTADYYVLASRSTRRSA